MPDPSSPAPTAPAATRRARGRGRRAKPRTRSFGGMLGLTVLSAVVPGSGFIAAGRRFIGFVILLAVGVGVMLAAGVLLVEHDPKMLAAELASRPNLLAVIGIAILVVAAIWVAVILLSNRALQSPDAPRWQRWVGGLVALALCVAVLYPSVLASRAAFATKTAIGDIFVPAPVVTNEAGETVVPSREDPWLGRPRVNILLLGGDSGVDREGLRTDTVMVASINTETGDTVLFSLPRNMQEMPFPRSSPLYDIWPDGFDCPESACLLNAIYEQGLTYADLYPESEHDPGIAAVRESVGEALGLDIDYYAIVNLQGFEDVVDALGGVNIDVGENRIPLGGITAGDRVKQEWEIDEWIEPGYQHLDGYHALWFARDRWNTDDYVRMRRQRCLINAIVDQADPATVVANYLSLVEATTGTVTSNVPPALFPAFVQLAERVQGKPLRSLPFTPSVMSPVHPDFDLIREIVQENLDPPAATTPPSSTPTTTSPDPSDPPTSESPTPDPTVAVDADAVCG